MEHSTNQYELLELASRNPTPDMTIPTPPSRKQLLAEGTALIRQGLTLTAEEQLVKTQRLLAMTKGKDISELTHSIVLKLYQSEYSCIETVAAEFDFHPEFLDCRISDQIRKSVDRCHSLPSLPKLLQKAKNHKVSSKRKHSRARTLLELWNKIQRSEREIAQQIALTQAEKLIREENRKVKIEAYAESAGMYRQDCSATKRALILDSIEARFGCSFRAACDGAGVPYATAIQFRNRKRNTQQA